MGVQYPPIVHHSPEYGELAALLKGPADSSACAAQVEKRPVRQAQNRLISLTCQELYAIVL
jgi:hypothetical protein